MNTTIVDVYNEITSVIDDAFSWGPFGSALDELVYCLVGSKLIMLEEALCVLHAAKPGHRR